jgi:hypothetical protein
MPIKIRTKFETQVKRMGNLPMSLLSLSNDKYARYKLDAVYESLVRLPVKKSKFTTYRFSNHHST